MLVSYNTRFETVLIKKGGNSKTVLKMSKWLFTAVSPKLWSWFVWKKHKHRGTGMLWHGQL